MTTPLLAPAPGFDQPLAVLKHCHGRIRKQLATLQKLQHHLPHAGADVEAQQAAYAILRWWPKPPRPSKIEIVEPIRFDEVARRTSIIGRQLLTYRMTKSLLTVFGPFGTAAARTGRGLNLHKKIEPYMPHHFQTFLLVSAGLIGGSLFLALRSGEPAAMVGSAGLAQIGGAITNVVLLWRYLPTRGGEVVAEDDDDE